MKRQKLATLLVVVVGLGVLLGGCVGTSGVKPVETAEVSPVVTINGVVQVAGSSIFIKKDGVSTEITSRKLDLKTYEGKSVTVIGEFSGTTLYVDEVK